MAKTIEEFAALVTITPKDGPHGFPGLLAEAHAPLPRHRYAPDPRVAAREGEIGRLSRALRDEQARHAQTTSRLAAVEREQGYAHAPGGSVKVDARYERDMARQRVEELREELAQANAELDAAVDAAKSAETDLAQERQRADLLNAWRFSSDRSDGALIDSLESLARQLIDGGGYSTPQQQAELRHAVALLAEHGVDVRAAREVKSAAGERSQKLEPWFWVPDELRHALRQLRHLYEQMLDGRVTDTAEAARGLLGPAIERVERVADRMVQP